MKVAELIRKLQEIGYDENTELTFSCVDGETGEYYVIPFEEITYGEALTGEPYENDVIDIGVDVDSVEEYMGNCNKEKVENNTIFIDNYIGHGYGKENEEIEDTIRAAMVKYGIPLDSTYTGKAFQGMKKYIAENNIKNKNILFIHTGGTPLFFDDLRRM